MFESSAIKNNTAMNILLYFLRLNIGDSLSLWLSVGWFWDKVLLCSPAWAWTNVSTPFMCVGVTSMFHTDYKLCQIACCGFYVPIMYQHLFFYNDMKSGNYQIFIFAKMCMENGFSPSS